MTVIKIILENIVWVLMALIAVNSWIAWRGWRQLRTTEKLGEEMARDLAHIVMVDNLLTGIVNDSVSSYVRSRPQDFVPPWARSMGHVRISCEIGRLAYGEGDGDE